MNFVRGPIGSKYGNPIIENLTMVETTVGYLGIDIIEIKNDFGNNLSLIDFSKKLKVFLHNKIVTKIIIV